MNVFLSYASEDLEKARKIRSFLVEHNFDVFDDRSDIAAGAVIARSIGDAIQDADAVIFLISKSSEKSQWVGQEIAIAISKKAEGASKRLVPVLLDRDAEVPFFLKDYLYLDLSRRKDFEISMTRLVNDLSVDANLPYEEELREKIHRIEIEKEFLELSNQFDVEYRAYRNRQLTLWLTAVAAISVLGAAFGVVSLVTDFQFRDVKWLLAFGAGVGVSTLFSILYLRTQRRSDTFLHQLRELEDARFREIKLKMNEWGRE